jgi:hypothetical protein
MADPLAQFRKTPQTPAPGATTPPKDTDAYAAFGTKDKVFRLRIRRAMAPTRSPGYAYLLDVVYDGSFGTNFVLVYTFLMVLVRGKNLQSLVFALENGMVDFIQEFDPDRWASPQTKPRRLLNPSRSWFKRVRPPFRVPKPRPTCKN